jgi:hypothetical protein
VETTNYIEVTFESVLPDHEFLMWSEEMFPARQPGYWLTCKKIGPNTGIEFESGLLFHISALKEIFIEVNKI